MATCASSFWPFRTTDGAWSFDHAPFLPIATAAESVPVGRAYESSMCIDICNDTVGKEKKL